jgi:hypothetical protein
MSTLPRSITYSKAAGPKEHHTPNRPITPINAVQGSIPAYIRRIPDRRSSVTKEILLITPCRRSVIGRRRVLIGKPPIRKTA